ncbi:MAG: hypothetical protein IKW33_02445 [Clostridia bacterium]|nr:hypothetical protein [Clostridia bacterium]
MLELKIYNTIKNYAVKNPVRFHMPGHKADEGFCALFKDACLDVTEVSSLKLEEVVLSAEEDLKKILQVEFCKILSGGTSLSVLALTYAVKGFGNSIIINRNSHQSIFNALKLFNIEPIFVGEELVNGFFTLPTAEQIDVLLKNNPNCIGAFLTYPDYFGRTFDIMEISNILKKRNKLFLIDNAHGGHFRYSFNGLYAGRYADAFCESTHKTLNSLNQGALIGVNNKNLINLVKEGVNIFSTTSPSYPILASVEYAVKKAFEETYKLPSLQKEITLLRNNLIDLGYKIDENTDIFKLSIDCKNLDVSAYEIERILEKNNIFVELCNERRILFMFSYQTKTTHINKLFNLLKSIITGAKQRLNKQKEITFGARKTTYLTAINGEYELVSLKESVGKISAVNVGTFPPCYPIICAGEEITKDSVEYLLSAKNVYGLTEEKIKIVRK